MKKILHIPLFGIYTISLLAHGAELDQPPPSWATLKAQYLIHSGHATYAEHPTSTGSAITVAFEGKAAKAFFDQMGRTQKSGAAPNKVTRSASCRTQLQDGCNATMTALPCTIRSRPSHD